VDLRGLAQARRPPRPGGRRKRLERPSEGLELRLEGGTAEPSGPNRTQPFGRHPLAQMRIAGPREPRLGPGQAETGVAGVFRAARHQDPVRQVAGRHVVDEGRRQLARAGEPDQADALAREPFERHALAATEDHDTSAAA